MLNDLTKLVPSQQDSGDPKTGEREKFIHLRLAV